MMKTRSCVVSLVCAFVLATPAMATNFVIVNGDGSGEGLNDPSPVSPVGGNTGTTLGEQRMIVLEAVAQRWAEHLSSPVDIRILARFNPMGNCNVLGSTGPGSAFMNFAGAPVPNVYFHSAVADSITGVDQNPGAADFFITYNSDWDTSACPAKQFYYGLDGNEPTNADDLFPVVLHEMGHGLGFASFVNNTNGVPYFGAPGIFDYHVYDLTSGLRWTQMSNAQRAASATNTFNLAWSGQHATEAVDGITFPNTQLELEVTAPVGIAGDYDSMRALFGGSSPYTITADLELVDTGTATPSDGCAALVGFTAGNVALIDRGQCQFGLKALNAQNAGAIAVIVMNNDPATPDALVQMQGGVDGDAVNIPAVFVSTNTGNALKGASPGVQGVMGKWFPMLYAPPTVAPGSSVSHWDDPAEPDLLMEPFTSVAIFDELDLTPAQLRDVGHTLADTGALFDDGFETGDTSQWSSVAP